MVPAWFPHGCSCMYVGVVMFGGCLVVVFHAWFPAWLPHGSRMVIVACMWGLHRRLGDSEECSMQFICKCPVQVVEFVNIPLLV